MPPKDKVTPGTEPRIKIKSKVKKKIKDEIPRKDDLEKPVVGETPRPPERSEVEAWLRSIGYRDKNHPGSYATWSSSLKVGNWVAIYDTVLNRPPEVYPLWEVKKNTVSYGPKPLGNRVWRKDNGRSENDWDQGRRIMTPVDFVT